MMNTKNHKTQSTKNHHVLKYLLKRVVSQE